MLQLFYVQSFLWFNYYTYQKKYHCANNLGLVQGLCGEVVRDKVRDLVRHTLARSLCGTALRGVFVNIRAFIRSLFTSQRYLFSNKTFVGVVVLL